MPTGKTAAAGQRSEKMLKRAFGTVRNAGHTARFRRMYSDNILGWLSRRMEEAGLTPERGVTEIFLTRAGEDMRHLAMEVDKLALFLGPGGRVTDEILPTYQCEFQTQPRIVFTLAQRHSRNQ